MDNILIRTDVNAIQREAEWSFPAEKQSFTLSEISTQSRKLASLLRQRGLGKGEKVALLLSNSSAYVIALLAIWRLNAIAVPLRPKGNRQTNYTDYVCHCDAVCDFRLMLHDDTMTAEALTHSQLSTKQHADISSLIFAAQDEPVLDSDAEISMDDIAILQFSSGSTGMPKGVMVTHGMMMAQLQNILYNHIGSRRGKPIESLASWMPFNHDMGLFIGVLAPLYVGAQNMLAPPSFYMRNPPRWFALMSERRVDMNFSTNSVLASTLKTLRRLQKQEDIDLSELHLYIGAEKVSPIIVRRCYDYLLPLGMKRENLHIGYGMAENALGAACTGTETITIQKFHFTGPNRLSPINDDSQSSIELVAVGSPDWQHEITIRNQNGDIQPELTLGEINIDSPCVTPGYYHDVEKSAEKIKQGRLLTGDLGFFYAGELYFYARQDDMIISAGRNITPDDIEMAVEELPFVRHGASSLIGMDNAQSGCVELVMLVEVNDHATADELSTYQQQIQAIAYENGDLILTNILFCQRGTIEKTSSGKKRRAVIRKRLINGKIITIGRNHGQRTAI